MAARLRGLIALLALALAGAACVYPFKVRVERDRSAGYEIDKAILEHLPIIDDPVVLGFLNDLGQEMLDPLEPQPFVYRFRLIRDPSLNAFAVAGGYIYMHTGTLLAAASIDEFAGVVAHEIAHTKARHWARMTEETALQNALAQIVAVGAAIGTGEPGLAVAAQGVNVALQLKHSRAFEAEADQLGVTFMSRTGYRPEGLARFFERLIAVRDSARISIPPYLYSHPAVEDRIAAVEDAAAAIVHGRASRPDHDATFYAIQARLARLQALRRTTLIDAPAFDAARSQPLLDRAAEDWRDGEQMRAITALRKAEAIEPSDPRTSFRLGERLEALDRVEDAIAAYRRTLRLDPTRAQVYYRIGRLYARDGSRHQAVYYLEQAARRAGPRSKLRYDAEQGVERMTFPVVLAAGLADGERVPGADSAAGHTRERFGTDDVRVAWWGEIADRFTSRRESLSARWRTPDGAVVAETPVVVVDGTQVRSELGPPDFDPSQTGRWTVEALFEGDVVDRRHFEVGPPQSGRGSAE